MSPLPINHPVLQFLRRLADWVVSPVGGFLAVAAAIAVFGCAYTVDEREQVVLTQFGRPVGEPINATDDTSGAGLDEYGILFRRAALVAPHQFDEVVTGDDVAGLAADDVVEAGEGAPLVTQALEILERVGDPPAGERVDHDVQLVAGRHLPRRAVPLEDSLLESVGRLYERQLEVEAGAAVGGLPPIKFGREALEKEILAAATQKVGIWGIELLDVRVKRINYKAGVIEKIYDRMMSERLQIAERFRSEGAGEAAKIEGKKDKDLQRIQSDAYRKVQEIKGKADAQASEIYAKAYTASPRAADFYAFMKTLDTYKSTLGRDATLILTTDSDLFRLLKSAGEPPSRVRVTERELGDPGFAGRL